MATEKKSDLLAQLKGNHLPDPPEAPELWPFYMSIIICVAALTVFWQRKLTSRRSWKQEALAQIDAIRSASTADSMLQLAILLKRVVLTVNPDQSTRTLHGEAWLEYLDEFFHTEFFSAGAGRAFGSELYRSQQVPDDQLYSTLRLLIEAGKWKR